MKSITTLFIFSLLILNVSAQKLDRIYQHGETNLYSEYFDLAFIHFSKLYQLQPDFQDVAYKLELCSLMLPEFQEKPIKEFVELSNKLEVEDKFYQYWLGRIYSRKGMHVEAIKAWKTFLNEKGERTEMILADTKEYIRQSEELVKSGANNSILTLNNKSTINLPGN